MEHSSQRKASSVEASRDVVEVGRFLDDGCLRSFDFLAGVFFTGLGLGGSLEVIRLMVSCALAAVKR